MPARNGHINVKPQHQQRLLITGANYPFPLSVVPSRPDPPEEGMFIFNTTTKAYEGYIGATWIKLGDADSSVADLSQELADLTDRVSVNETDIASFQAQIDANADDIITLQDSTSANATALTNHRASNIAHAAQNITFSPTGSIEATEVQSAIAEVATDAASALSEHEADADPHPQYLTESEGDAAYQPLDDELTAIAGLDSAADRVPYFTGLAAAALAVLTSFGRSLIAAVDAAAGRTLLDAQQADADLAALAALSGTGYAQRTGADTWSLADTVPADDITGLGTMAQQDSDAVNITGGAIDGTPIGDSSASTGIFTGLDAVSLTVSDIIYNPAGPTVTITDDLEVTGKGTFASLVGDYLDLPTISEPSAPSSGTVRLWFDGTSIYAKDSSGANTAVVTIP